MALAFERWLTRSKSHHCTMQQCQLIHLYPPKSMSNSGNVSSIVANVQKICSFASNSSRCGKCGQMLSLLFDGISRVVSDLFYKIKSTKKCRKYEMKNVAIQPTDSSTFFPSNCTVDHCQRCLSLVKLLLHRLSEWIEYDCWLLSMQYYLMDFFSDRIVDEQWFFRCHRLLFHCGCGSNNAFWGLIIDSALLVFGRLWSFSHITLDI